MINAISYLYDWWYQSNDHKLESQLARVDNNNSETNEEQSLNLDINDFEFINLPDDREINITVPSQRKEDNNIVAGFDKKKLLEMALFSKISYGNNDDKLQKSGYQTKAELIQDGYEIIPFSNERGMSGFIFAKGKKVSIAYHGTKDMYDVCTDLNTSCVRPSFLKEGMFHKGFYDEFKSSWKGAYNKLNSYAKKQGLEVSNLDINLTGHSMGGALAKIAALWLNKEAGLHNIHVATFGDPRVFDYASSQIYNECLGENTLRVTQHRRDPVTAVPQGIIGFAHVGQQLRVPAALGLLQVHKIDGYNLAIKELSEREYRSNNSVSWFYYPTKMIGTLTCNLNYYIGHNDSIMSWGEYIKQGKNDNKTPQVSI